jgi:hypothetical protein
MDTGSPGMPCHEQGRICLLAYPTPNVIASEARRSRFSTDVEIRDCFVAFAPRNDNQISLPQVRKSRAQYYCAEWWDNLSNIRRKALRFSALPGSGMHCREAMPERFGAMHRADDKLMGLWSPRARCARGPSQFAGPISCRICASLCDRAMPVHQP